MNDYRPDTYCVRLFVGRGDYPLNAADEAAAELNAWEPFRLWCTADGKSCFDVTTTMTQGDNEWVCVLTVVGVDIEARERTDERAYTGTTERLG